MKIERVSKEDIFKFILDNADEICMKHSLKIKEGSSIHDCHKFFDGKMSTTSEDHEIAVIIEGVICGMYGLHYKINVIEKDDHCTFYKRHIKDECIEAGESFKGYVYINNTLAEVIGKRYSDFVICKFPIMGDALYKMSLGPDGLFIKYGEYTLDNSFDQYATIEGEEVVLFNKLIVKEIVNPNYELTRIAYTSMDNLFKKLHENDPIYKNHKNHIDINII